MAQAIVKIKHLITVGPHFDSDLTEPGRRNLVDEPLEPGIVKTLVISAIRNEIYEVPLLDRPASPCSNHSVTFWGL
ncbi:MAG TPA: hypothetical protein PLV96_00395 [Methanoregulaceae archaeon]|nr:hypothetical protein [Methanoregulaceae archaeon]